MKELKFGDALVELEKLDNESIDCLITDPPYGIDYQSNYRNENFEKIDRIKIIIREFIPAKITISAKNNAANNG